MNQVARKTEESRALSPVENYTMQVMGDEGRQRDLWSALPAHVKPERFKRNLVNLLMQKPDMLKYDPRLIFREVSKAAALGLLLDPQLGEGYIVPVWNGPAKRQEPQLRVGYRGLIKLGRQSGEVANIYPGEVRELDPFVAREGTERQLIHDPDYTKPRGHPVCYYAVAVYKDGTKDFEVMTMESIYEIRDRSDSWKAFQKGVIKSSPWDTDEGEMCKKTVLRRLLKRVPQSPELSDAIALENAADEFSRPLQVVPMSRANPQPVKSIEGRLDAFANGGDTHPDDDVSEPSAHPLPGEEDSGSRPEAGYSSGQSAPSGSELGNAGEGADTSGDADPDKLKQAREAGRAACRDGFTRDVPKKYAAKTKQAEREAYLRGWDEEHGDQMSAEAGVV